VQIIGTLGASRQDVELSRQFGILSSKGKTERDQVFGSLGVEGLVDLADNWVLRPSASVFVSRSQTDGYVDNAGRAIGKTKADMSLLNVGGVLIYTGETIAPYVSASWNRDLENNLGSDRDFGRLGAGVAFQLTPAVSVDIGASTVVGKSHEKEAQVGATLVGRF